MFNLIYSQNGYTGCPKKKRNSRKKSMSKKEWTLFAIQFLIIVQVNYPTFLSSSAVTQLIDIPPKRGV